MRKVLKSMRFCAILALWAQGAFVLRQLWNFQKSLPDPLGSYIEFSMKSAAILEKLMTTGSGDDSTEEGDERGKSGGGSSTQQEIGFLADV
jgi:hypothetical protein